MNLSKFSPSDILKWSRAQSLWYYVVYSDCCANEFIETVACRYDLERFGCIEQNDPRQADLLIIYGAINKKSAAYVKKIYSVMKDPKYVIAIGACACKGGAFVGKKNYCVLEGAEKLIPVDVFVPGCPLDLNL